MVINLSNTTDIYERTETLKQYYADIKKFPLLSKEEEDSLFQKMKSNDKKIAIKARQKIIESNQRFVVAVAKRYATQTNLLDLINEGNIGLIEALETFDTTKNIKFTTWAVWFIRRAINMYSRANNTIIRKTNVSKTYHRLSKLRNKFIQEFERYPTDEELITLLQDECNVKITDPGDLTEFQVTSIDEGFNSDSDDNYVDNEFNVASASFNNYENQVNSDYTAYQLNKLFKQLSPRDEKIIKLLYGIGYERAYEIKEVGQMMNMTAERIRQLKESIVKEMASKFKTVI